MRVRTSTFCGIATSAVWQTWLFSFNEDLYRNFMAKLHESKGCAQNREIMMELLDTMQKSGYEDALVEFLQQKFPAALMENPPPAGKIDNNLFPDYVPGVLTYPHRMIINTGDNIVQQANEFLKGKVRSDMLIKNGVAYIEYLLPEEKSMEIPDGNWLIRAFKEKHRKNNPTGAK